MFISFAIHFDMGYLFCFLMLLWNFVTKVYMGVIYWLASFGGSESTIAGLMRNPQNPMVPAPNWDKAWTIWVISGCEVGTSWQQTAPSATTRWTAQRTACVASERCTLRMCWLDTAGCPIANLSRYPALKSVQNHSKVLVAKKWHVTICFSQKIDISLVFIISAFWFHSPSTSAHPIVNPAVQMLLWHTWTRWDTQNSQPYCTGCSHSTLFYPTPKSTKTKSRPFGR